MEQILIRNLPDGTKAALRARAEAHHGSVEAEARAMLTAALALRPASLLDVLGMDDGADVDFDPPRLGTRARSADL